jgi:hypothetical protein
MGYAWNDMAQYLVERGYHVLVSEWQLLERYGAGHAWQSASEFPCGLGSPNAWGNLICTPDSKVYERVLLGFHTFEGRNRRWATVRRLLDRVVSL